jgi:hypothetical protein
MGASCHEPNLDYENENYASLSLPVAFTGRRFTHATLHGKLCKVAVPTIVVLGHDGICARPIVGDDDYEFG